MDNHITKIQDLGNEKNQKLFLAFANVFFDGNIQKAIEDLNVGVSELEILENISNESLPLNESLAEIQLRFTSQ